jgi:hypothetical protein
MEIPEINIRDLSIPTVPQWAIEPSIAVPIYPPVTSQVGLPIVNMPGCVESHEDSNKNANLPNNDPDQVKIFCDGEMPSFNAINYDARRLQYETEKRSQEVPPVKSPEEPEAPKPPTSQTPSVPKTDAPLPECPTREQQLKNPIGKILEGNKKITGYEVVGKECLMVTENLTIPDQIVSNIPNAGAVTATASIAVVATSSALLAKPLADLLLRVVKPVVKKVLTKVATLRGKKIPVQSTSERLAEQRQRNRAVKELRSVRPLKK